MALYSQCYEIATPTKNKVKEFNIWSKLSQGPISVWLLFSKNYPPKIYKAFVKIGFKAWSLPLLPTITLIPKCFTTKWNTAQTLPFSQKSKKGSTQMILITMLPNQNLILKTNLSLRHKHQEWGNAKHAGSWRSKRKIRKSSWKE